jgi:hypothetical protein
MQQQAASSSSLWWREEGVLSCCLYRAVGFAAGKLVGFISEALHGAAVAVLYG